MVLDRLEQNRKIKKLVDGLTPVLKSRIFKSLEEYAVKISRDCSQF
jgi:hypothetical protein